jgi:hypothetical protein
VITGLRAFAETLRRYVQGNPEMPPGMTVTLDGAPSDGPSLDLQLNQGAVERAYIDGTRVMAQPFTLIYRDAFTESPGDKSDMIGVLNGMGAEMERAGPPVLGPGMRALSLEQSGSANIAEQDARAVGYAAAFVLKYEQRPS